ncbi:MAG: hypothetical protein GY870_18205, partial [archaeon]|nr:hypothetical protein [archaeon]
MPRFARVRMYPDRYFSDKEIKKRYKTLFGKDAFISDEMIPGYRKKWSSLSGFVKETKQTFS